MDDKIVSGLHKKLFFDILKMTLSRLVVIGTTLATCMSWQANSSIPWAIVHGIFGWAYIFYSIKNWILLSLLLGYLITSFWKAGALYLELRRILHGTKD